MERHCQTCGVYREMGDNRVCNGCMAAYARGLADGRKEAESRAEAAERERDAAFNKGQNHALKEISTYLDVTCPTYGAVKSAIQKLQSERDQWREDAKVLADELQMFHAYSSGRMPLSINASDAITRAGGGA